MMRYPELRGRITDDSPKPKRTGKKRKGKKRPMVRRESFAFSGIMGK